MNPARLQQVEELYHSAREREAGQRGAFLAEACGGDDDLRREVESLLAQSASGDVMERPAVEVAASLLGPVHAGPADGLPTTTDPASAAHVGFAPGTILGQRYRICHVLGRGGMGEVYRADDLLLGQPVALKFLSARATANASLVSRFRNEVRTARQVSHPNVCRVHDIGEAEGLVYLSMEYVDGEDLASLLRRIGKLPQDKALEIARKLCAGLSAAHEKGVIHRDLKPANIMLDGRGHVRITDFGIAGVAEQIRDVRSGTPAYMSPEQLAGKVVTPRSDIYALGIVLHELFTGKRPPHDPADTDLDPAIERVIQSCLETDPQMRPATPLAVAARLPGGDPLAAALAAGETPTPELVAQAGPVEGLRPWVAVACLAVVLIGLGLLCVLRQRNDLINQIPMENSSEVLAAKAREIAKSFGYTERPVDSLFAWSYDTDYLRYVSTQKNVSARDPHFYAPHPPAVYFWYRQSSRYPSILDFDDDISAFRRETLEPDMQAVVLDSEGRLVEFQARPPIQLARNANAAAFEWSRLFAAAGLDPARFQEVQPELSPAAPFDTQAAWTGSWDAGAGNSLRVEAAAYRGRPVLFRVLGPWTRPSQPTPLTLGTFSVPMFVGFVIFVPAVAGLLAWRNARSGRGDRRGAFRLAACAFVCMLLLELAIGDHAPTSTEFVLLFAVLREAITVGGLFWVLYMAFEPQVRRRSPEALISWSRLLSGRFRDPMVGGHVLAGLALGVSSVCLLQAFLTPTFQSASLQGTLPPLPWSAGAFCALWLSHAITGVGGGLSYMFVLNLIVVPVRLRWLSVSIFIVLLTLLLTTGYDTGPIFAILRSVTVFGMVAIALTRFGVLTATAAVYAWITLVGFPLTTNWSAWYAKSALFGLATLVALASYGFVTTLAGRRIWPKRIEGA
jgi:serine/threonine-protein kinase